jgi:beta-phosphoglucomutase-like phosphatase (HAD superfamily)
LIAFDWDGTLFDSTRIITRCIQEAVRDVGGAVPDDQAASYVIGMALIPALAHAAPDVPKEKYPELGARYRHHYLQHKDDISLFEGVLPLLCESASIGWPWPPARAGWDSMTRCRRWSCTDFSMRPAQQTKRRANPTRSCCTN